MTAQSQLGFFLQPLFPRRRNRSKLQTQGSSQSAPMEGYFSAVQKMEQTVMFPSLLLGVSMEDQRDAIHGSSDDRAPTDRDLYEYFTLLKSIKLTAEGGLGALKDKCLHIREDEVKEEKGDLEGLFHYHVSGLRHVLVELTRRANTVTSKYNEIMGQINRNEMSYRW